MAAWKSLAMVLSVSPSSTALLVIDLILELITHSRSGVTKWPGIIDLAFSSASGVGISGGGLEPAFRGDESSGE